MFTFLVDVTFPCDRTLCNTRQLQENVGRIYSLTELNKANKQGKKSKARERGLLKSCGNLTMLGVVYSRAMLGSTLTNIKGDNSSSDSLNITGPEPDLTKSAAIIMMAGAVLSLVANSFMVILVAVIRRLQRSQNAFIVHQLVIDTIKSIHIIMFTKSLYEGLPSQHCATLFSSYIILVTASTFNLMAITTTEIYHFTNKLVEISVSNFCCVCFGITLVWVTSVVVNLGVAFMPSISTFHKEIGICSFAYGITGNYLLHVLWIALLTMVLIVNLIYLARLKLDIHRRHYQRIFQMLSRASSFEEVALDPPSRPNSLVISGYHSGGNNNNNNNNNTTDDNNNSKKVPTAEPEDINIDNTNTTESRPKHSSSCLGDEDMKFHSQTSRTSFRSSVRSSGSRASFRRPPVVHRLPRAGRQRIYVHRRQSSTQKAARAIINNTRNLYLLVTMSMSFIIFWYPIFLLTIIDIFVKADPKIYRALTLLGWSHSLTTPLFFLGFNYSALFEKEDFEHDNKISMDVASNGEVVGNGHTSTSRRPDSLEIPDTPMSYTSKLSYQVVCQLIEEKVSPTVLSHVLELQSIKESRRKLLPSATCPERLNRTTTLNSIPEYQPMDDKETERKRNYSECSSKTLPANLVVHRLSTGCLTDNHHQIRRDSRSLDNLDMPIYAWI